MIVAEFLVYNQQEWQGEMGWEVEQSRENGQSFLVCNMASEIAVEDRLEKCVAANMSLCAIPSEAKIRDVKR